VGAPPGDRLRHSGRDLSLFRHVSRGRARHVKPPLWHARGGGGGGPRGRAISGGPFCTRPGRGPPAPAHSPGNKKKKKKRPLDGGGSGGDAAPGGVMGLAGRGGGGPGAAHPHGSILWPNPVGGGCFLKQPRASSTFFGGLGDSSGFAIAGRPRGAGILRRGPHGRAYWAGGGGGGGG